MINQHVVLCVWYLGEVDCPLANFFAADVERPSFKGEGLQVILVGSESEENDLHDLWNPVQRERQSRNHLVDGNIGEGDDMTTQGLAASVS
jgi:hypothetical protein